MQRSFSVPVNVKVKSLRRTDSSGCLVRVISATPRPRTDENNVVDNATEIETGKYYSDPMYRLTFLLRIQKQDISNCLVFFMNSISIVTVVSRSFKTMPFD